jgi:hypothetical protein
VSVKRCSRLASLTSSVYSLPCERELNIDVDLTKVGE